MTSAENRVTLQQIFDAAWQAFIVEGKPPGVKWNCNKFWDCAYLAPSGAKCAIGLCIPDGHPYQSSAKTFDGLVQEDKFLIQPVFDEEIHQMIASRLRDFQEQLHDDLCLDDHWPGRETMIDAYKKVAFSFNLTIPAGAEQ